MFEQGAKGGGGAVRVLLLPGAGAFGVTAARKTGCKPRRNRVRRRLREAACLCNLPSGFDVVFVGGGKTLEIDFPDLVVAARASLAEALERWAARSVSS